MSHHLATASYDLTTHPECEHMQLVVWTANRVARQFKRIPGMEFDDLLHIGYLALRRAYQNYDPERGTASLFRSIRRDMWDAISTQRSIVRVPEFACRLAQAVEHGKPIPRGHGKGGKRLASAKAAAKVRAAVCRRIDAALAVVGAGLDERWIDREWIETALRSLTPREALVVRLHYGLDDEEELTFAQIGERLGMRRAGVWHIEQKAMAGLRAAV